jgi:hypothetical protein
METLADIMSPLFFFPSSLLFIITLVALYHSYLPAVRFPTGF